MLYYGQLFYWLIAQFLGFRSILLACHNSAKIILITDYSNWIWSEITLISNDMPEKSETSTTSPQKNLLNKIEANPCIILVEKHPFIVSILLSAIGALLTFIFNACVFVYWGIYAYHWHIDMSYMQINVQNTLYIFFVAIIVTVVFTYPFYLWARKLYMSLPARIISLVLLGVPLGFPFIPNLKIPSLLSLIAECLFLLSFICVLMIPIGFICFFQTKEYEKHRQKRRENKSTDTAKHKSISGLSRIVVGIGVIFIVPILYIAGLSLADAYSNTTFSYFMGDDSGSYVVLYQNSNNLYAAKCDIDYNHNIITVYPSVYKLIPTQGLKLERQTFQCVNRNNNPSFWSGGLCTIVDGYTYMPVKTKSKFSTNDKIFLAGRFNNASGKENLQVNWHFPNGTNEKDNITLTGNEPYHTSYYASKIGCGSGEVTITERGTGKVIADYSFAISK